MAVAVAVVAVVAVVAAEVCNANMSQHFFLYLAHTLNARRERGGWPPEWRRNAWATYVRALPRLVC